MNWSQFLLSLDGRIDRRTYWLRFILPCAVIQLAVAVAAPPLQFNVVMLTTWGLFLWPLIATGAKRCHDLDRSGWWLLLGLVPVIGPLWLMSELGFRLGTSGPNRFGKDTSSGPQTALDLQSRVERQQHVD